MPARTISLVVWVVPLMNEPNVLIVLLPDSQLIGLYLLLANRACVMKILKVLLYGALLRRWLRHETYALDT
jgi:hypothetical protein